ncbi:hypothetical protein FB45DRAFT_864570 [Roridomyces roridus]|uniref:Uncharacterized protein n=1 Tax=Roridomyces roridus TaxID=1738132 RepID=A0AAD7FT05_9AGAR|nr:hypothetical protein FB45DRAFT_864570 [Roridomyces roridus]
MTRRIFPGGVPSDPRHLLGKWSCGTSIATDCVLATSVSTFGRPSASANVFPLVAGNHAGVLSGFNSSAGEIPGDGCQTVMSALRRLGNGTSGKPSYQPGGSLLNSREIGFDNGSARRMAFHIPPCPHYLVARTPGRSLDHFQFQIMVPRIVKTARGIGIEVDPRVSFMAASEKA